MRVVEVIIDVRLLFRTMQSLWADVLRRVLNRTLCERSFRDGKQWVNRSIARRSTDGLTGTRASIQLLDLMEVGRAISLTRYVLF